MAVKPGTQGARVLHALRDGRWHSVAEIHRRAGTMRLNSRVSELRKHGFNIEHRVVTGKPRQALAHQYRLINVTDVPDDIVANGPHQTQLNRDEVERTPQTRYRLYRLFRNEPQLVAACPDPAALGHSIVTLGQRGEFRESCIGILDTHGTDTVAGTWVVNPWDTEPTS